MPGERKFCGWKLINQQKFVVTTTSLEKKTNFRSFIYSHNSTNSANLVTIGPADVGIIGLIEIVKNK